MLGKRDPWSATGRTSNRETWPLYELAIQQRLSA